MKSVRVLMREDVVGLGDVGDVVTVAAGYARNYLVPKRIAVEATEENVRVMQRRRGRLDAERAARAERIAERVEALRGVRLHTRERADEGGSLYGSVNAAAIARMLQDEGFPVEERDVRLAEPIKSVGTHEVPVHVHGDVGADVVVEVEAE